MKYGQQSIQGQNSYKISLCYKEAAPQEKVTAERPMGGPM